MSPFERAKAEGAPLIAENADAIASVRERFEHLVTEYGLAAVLMGLSLEIDMIRETYAGGDPTLSEDLYTAGVACTKVALLAKEAHGRNEGASETVASRRGGAEQAIER